MEGYDIKSELKPKLNKGRYCFNRFRCARFRNKGNGYKDFEELKIDTELLNFDPELEGKEFECQKAYQLWCIYCILMKKTTSVSGMETSWQTITRKVWI